MGQIGGRIADFINKKNINDLELREKLKVSRSTVWRWKNAKTEPDLDIVARMVQNFPVRAYWLLTGEGDMEWKGEEDPEIKFLLKRILGDEFIKKTLYNFIKWQEALSRPHISQGKEI